MLTSLERRLQHLLLDNKIKLQKEKSQQIEGKRRFTDSFPGRVSSYMDRRKSGTVDEIGSYFSNLENNSKDPIQIRCDSDEDIGDEDEGR